MNFADAQKQAKQFDMNLAEEIRNASPEQREKWCTETRQHAQGMAEWRRNLPEEDQEALRQGELADANKP